MGQGKLGGSALEGMARNPAAGGDIRTSMLLGMAFPESLVIFAFAISFLLLSKLG
jgi:F-type H+-transporting ATPase subunit c